MKELIVSLKSSSEVIDGFKDALAKVERREIEGTHYEISFDDPKDFDFFARHIIILSRAMALKPNSIAELAKLSGIPKADVNKAIVFFESFGVVRIEKRIIDGRQVSKPIVCYNSIRIDLNAA